MRLAAVAISPFFLAISSSAATRYSEYILAPVSRIVYPTGVRQTVGEVVNPHALISHHGITTLTGRAAITYDFGKNIAGLVSVHAGQSAEVDAQIWVTYTESDLWISYENWFRHYGAPHEQERGAFRYLSISNKSNGTVELNGVSVFFTAAPTQDLQAYTGYFHSNDETLNRIWYAGAYTNQLCTIDPTHGLGVLRTETPEGNPWYYNYTIANQDTCLTDGAKRDRVVWPGDMFTALPSVIYSTYDLDSLRNSLESLLALQHPNGQLPYSGLPWGEDGTVSFTYHLHNLVGVANYYLYSGDASWLSNHWDQFKKGLNWSIGHIDQSGLMNVTASSDWLRSGMSGYNIEANALLHLVLNLGITLADAMNDRGYIPAYQSTAATLKASANTLLWDPSASLYRDNESTDMHPQDGNSMAILANFTLSPAQSSAISAALAARLGPFGAPAPEVPSSPPTISPFAGGFELEAHFLAGNSQAALNLLRTQWGFMLNDPRMTNSTFIEGYAADGSLRYAPYALDARISHAHGWSSAPTSVLSRFVGGLRITGPGGAGWRVEPVLGDLDAVEVGLRTALGDFAVSVKGEGGRITGLEVQTPEGTVGDVVLPEMTKGMLVKDGVGVELAAGKAQGLNGGNWTLVVQ